jgi:hypothetical protein
MDDTVDNAVNPADIQNPDNLQHADNTYSIDDQAVQPLNVTFFSIQF